MRPGSKSDAHEGMRASAAQPPGGKRERIQLNWTGERGAVDEICSASAIADRCKGAGPSYHNALRVLFFSIWCKQPKNQRRRRQELKGRRWRLGLPREKKKQRERESPKSSRTMTRLSIRAQHLYNPISFRPSVKGSRLSASSVISCSSALSTIPYDRTLLVFTLSTLLLAYRILLAFSYDPSPNVPMLYYPIQ